MLVNLLGETLQIIQQHGKSVDLVWCVADTTAKTVISWEEFAKSAKRIEYENFARECQINPDLVVIGVDWWLERKRHTVVDRQGWTYHSMPRVAGYSSVGSIRLLETERDRQSKREAQR